MSAPTVRPRQQQAPVRRPREHSEWAHGPVAAAINASLVIALLAVVVRLTHLPSSLGLLVGAVMAGVFVIAGNLRRPRRLALRSVVYRGVAMLAAGVWLWFETADFSRVGPGAVTGLAMFAVGVAGVVGTLLCLRTGRGPLVSLTFTGVALAGLATGGTTMLLTHVGRVFGTAAPINKVNYLSWLWHGTISLVILAAAFAVLGAVCANHEAELDDTMQQALLMRSHGRDLVNMQTLLRDVGRWPRLAVTRYTRWDNGAGEDYEIDGTADGVTPADVNQLKDTLAAMLNLDNGCGVEAVQGATRGRIILSVSRVNRISGDHRYPQAYRQRSIYNGLPIGVLRDGTEVNVKLRESSAFVFGQKRSGKTTTLFDIAAGILQCTDAIIWVIDFGGGGVALPFLYPYADGRMKIPAIDWVATTVDEAKKMADLALAIATDRKTFYKHRKRAANTNLLPLDADVPEIIIMIDEGAEAMGETAGMSYDAKQVRGTLEKIVRTAGDSGVNVVFSGLAATMDVIDRMTLAQLAVRVGMRVTETRELAYGFDSNYDLNPADIPYQGSGFVKASHAEPTRVFKAYLLEPNQMAEIAIATESWRPPLDDRGRELGRTVYADRWVRTKHLLADEHGNVLVDVDADAGPADVDNADDDPPFAVVPAPVAQAAPGPVDDVDMDAGLRPFDVEGSPDELLAQADRAVARLQAAAAAVGGGDDEDDLDQDAVNRRFADAMRNEFDWTDPTTWQMETPPPPGIETARNPDGPSVLEALVKAAGPGGLLAKDVKEKLRTGGAWGPPVTVTDQTIHEWLKTAGWLAKRRPRAPYVHHSFTS
jgi:hypothetical protein